MEDNNKKRKTTGLLLSVLGVLSLVLITAGVTYAFFNYAKEGQTVNTIRTGTIEFAYNETDGVGQGINISNAMPTDDNTGASVTSEDTEYGKLFRFTITSKTPSTAKIPYYVTIRKTDGTLGNNQVKVYLEATPASTEEGAANYTFSGTKGENNFSVNTFGDLLTNHAASAITMIGSNATANEAVMYKGTIPANQSNLYTNSFVLRMWLAGGESAGNNAADYSPYEFMLKTVAGASNQTVTTTTEDTVNGGYKTISLPVATNTSELDAETYIANGSFITSTAYYALPETAGTYWYCDGASIADENAECAGTKTSKTFDHGRGEYERIAYVNTTTKKVYTLSQSLAGATPMATVDEFGNYTFATTPANYTATEQYYRINGATFTAIVNVYADATVVTSGN